MQKGDKKDRKMATSVEIVDAPPHVVDSEIRNVLCSISFNKASDESLASNHDNTFFFW
jgi:hypothetical protein